jgi:hypothetical protein
VTLETLTGVVPATVYDWYWHHFLERYCEDFEDGMIAVSVGRLVCRVRMGSIRGIVFAHGLTFGTAFDALVRTCAAIVGRTVQRQYAPQAAVRRIRVLICTPRRRSWLAGLFRSPDGVSRVLRGRQAKGGKVDGSTVCCTRGRLPVFQRPVQALSRMQTKLE